MIKEIMSFSRFLALVIREFVVDGLARDLFGMVNFQYNSRSDETGLNKLKIADMIAVHSPCQVIEYNAV